EHFLGYNIEYITGQGYVHGQLICLCTYVMARLQDNKPQWVYSLIERTRCPWRLNDLGISREAFIKALLTLLVRELSWFDTFIMVLPFSMYH
ncbi:MAG: hypothetical protein ACXWPS_21625, partial [Ktedonobacteraceae bacterium]